MGEGEGRAVLWGDDRKTKLMMVLIHIRCFGGQASERAATVGFDGVVKCLIRALVPKPISKCLLVGHSFCRLPIQNWDLKKGLFWSHFLVE